MADGAPDTRRAGRVTSDVFSGGRGIFDQALKAYCHNWCALKVALFLDILHRGSVIFGFRQTHISRVYGVAVRSQNQNMSRGFRNSAIPKPQPIQEDSHQEIPIAREDGQKGFPDTNISTKSGYSQLPPDSLDVARSFRISREFRNFKISTKMDKRNPPPTHHHLPTKMEKRTSPDTNISTESGIWEILYCLVRCGPVFPNLPRIPNFRISGISEFRNMQKIQKGMAPF